MHDYIVKVHITTVSLCNLCIDCVNVGYNKNKLKKKKRCMVHVLKLEIRYISFIHMLT